MDIDFFETNWMTCMSGLGIATESTRAHDAFQQCLRAYQEDGRAYHTLQHLRECLHLANEVADLDVDRHAITLALWFHDVVYDVHAHDNEARSADVATAFLESVSSSTDLQQNIRRLILATAHNVPLQSMDERLVCDIDLSILGAPSPRYVQYTQQVRQEYAFVPAALYATKRIEILEAFLARAHVYALPSFVDRFEKQARSNIAMEIRGLQSVGDNVL